MYLDAYWIYKNDVTVAQYRKFCQANGQFRVVRGGSWILNYVPYFRCACRFLLDPTCRDGDDGFRAVGVGRADLN